MYIYVYICIYTYTYVYISKVMAVTFLGSRVTEAQGAGIKRCIGLLLPLR